jgi:hypothetical protein
MIQPIWMEKKGHSGKFRFVLYPSSSFFQKPLYDSKESFIVFGPTFHIIFSCHGCSCKAEFLSKVEAIEGYLVLLLDSQSMYLESHSHSPL